MGNAPPKVNPYEVGGEPIASKGALPAQEGDRHQTQQNETKRNKGAARTKRDKLTLADIHSSRIAIDIRRLETQIIALGKLEDSQVKVRRETSGTTSEDSGAGKSERWQEKANLDGEEGSGAGSEDSGDDSTDEEDQENDAKFRTGEVLCAKCVKDPKDPNDRTIDRCDVLFEDGKKEDVPLSRMKWKWPVKDLLEHIDQLEIPLPNHEYATGSKKNSCKKKLACFFTDLVPESIFHIASYIHKNKEKGELNAAPQLIFVAEFADKDQFPKRLLMATLALGSEVMRRIVIVAKETVATRKLDMLANLEIDEKTGFFKKKPSTAIGMKGKNRFLKFVEKGDFLGMERPVKTLLADLRKIQIDQAHIDFVILCPCQGYFGALGEALNAKNAKKDWEKYAKKSRVVFYSSNDALRGISMRGDENTTVGNAKKPALSRSPSGWVGWVPGTTDAKFIEEISEKSKMDCAFVEINHYRLFKKPVENKDKEDASIKKWEHRLENMPSLAPNLAGRLKAKNPYLCT